MKHCIPPREPWHWFPVEYSDCASPGADIHFEGGDLSSGDGLKSLVLMQLLTDRRRDGERGWWGDYSMPFEVGSYLWTLQGKPKNEQTLIDAERFTSQALDPLIAQGLAEGYSVEASFVNGTLTIAATLLDRDGSALASVQRGF